MLKGKLWPSQECSLPAFGTWALEVSVILTSPISAEHAVPAALEWWSWYLKFVPSKSTRTHARCKDYKGKPYPPPAPGLLNALIQFSK